MYKYLILLGAAVLWKLSKAEQPIQPKTYLDKDEMDNWLYANLIDLGYAPGENEVQDMTDVFCMYVQAKQNHYKPI